MGLIGFSDPEHHAMLLWLCTTISYSVLAVTFWYKGPQVYAVVHSGSSMGISMTSLVLEFTSYSIEMTYQIGMSYPIDTYFEIILMWMQDIILLYVILDNRHLMSFRLLPVIMIYLVCFAYISQRWFPDLVMYTLISSTTLMLIVSKSLQLHKVISTENPGSLSALTWSLLTYLAMARILTTSVVTGDVMMLMNTTSATFLDAAVAASIIYYNRVKADRIRWRRSH